MSFAIPSFITSVNRNIVAKVTFVIIFLIGAALRLVDFPNLPLGFNQDEISAGYESWSLFHYGAQSWGERFPVYFSSGGAGQNVLYAYLNMPFMGFFGLDNPFGTRLLELLIGLGTLPLMYVFVRRLYSRGIALGAMFLTAVIPWHWMLSRWGLESNILPFVVLLGAYLVTVALQTKKTWVTIISLIPFALACYAYGIACVPVFIMIILLLVFYHRLIFARWHAWLVSFVLFLVVAAPFALFLGKTYLHLHYPFEQYLPFSLPDLSQNRLSDLQQSQSNFWVDSINFVLLNGSNDNTAWNGLPPAAGSPFPSLVFFFAIGECLRRLLHANRLHHLRLADITIIDIWAFSSLAIWVIIPVDLNETNIIYLPVIVLAVSFIFHVFYAIKPTIIKVAAAILLIIVSSILLIPAVIVYFSPSYAQFNATNFNPGLRQALENVQYQAAGEPIYVSDSIHFNYLQTLWYLKIPPTTFRQYHPTYADPDFENFVFAPERINTKQLTWFLIYSDESHIPCAQPTHVRIINNYYRIGLCPAGSQLTAED